MSARTIGDYIKQNQILNDELFTSTIFSQTVKSIRDIIDPAGLTEGTYAYNSVDNYILHEFGDWELTNRMLRYGTDGSVIGYDATAIQNAVDMLISKNAYAWENLAKVYQMEFNPLYNVDANESITHEYGQHITDRKQGPHDDEVQHGQHTETNTLSQTTMDDTATFRPKQKTEGSNPQYSDVYKYPEVTNTETSQKHTDTDTIRRYGNIGVTKSTELLDDYWDFVQRSVVPIIGRAIANELCYTIWW